MNSEILQLNFKKIKSNSINVIDFESTLGSRNKPFYDQSDQKLMFKRDSIKIKRENRIKNSIMNKYIDKESNNFNSIHFSQNENFSGKTKETNLTNPESNRQTNSIISSAKLSQQFEINKLLGKDIKNLNNYNDTNKHLKKWNNNSMTLEHFRPVFV